MSQGQRIESGGSSGPGVPRLRHAALGMFALLLFSPAFTVARLGVPALRCFNGSRHLADEDWSAGSTPRQRREAAHAALTFRWGNLHDACITLIYEGNIESVPYLIRALKWIREGECTEKHCLEALRRITGKDVGEDYESWQKWWNEEGSLEASGTGEGG